MDEGIDWLTLYNHRRLRSTLGCFIPMQFEKTREMPASDAATGGRIIGTDKHCVKQHHVQCFSSLLVLPPQVKGFPLELIMQSAQNIITFFWRVSNGSGIG